MRSALEDPAVSGPVADAERLSVELAADIRAVGRFAFITISFAVGAALSALILLP